MTDLDNVSQHQIIYKKVKAFKTVFAYISFEPFIGTIYIVFQMEQLMDRMQDETTGIPVRTVNKFRAKVPSVFTGKLMLNSSSRLKRGF